MKQAILHGPRDLRLEPLSLDTENLKSHEIWVQTEITALKIGTDRGNYEGAERVPGAPDYPRYVGDSNLGIVRRKGSEVTRFAVGDRIFSRKPHVSDYIAADHEELIKVPSGIAAEDAVYLGLYYVSALSYWRTYYQAGETVAVVGLGVLGMADVALGRAFGARVIAVGNSPIRLEMAKRMGAHLCVMSDDPALQEKLAEFAGSVGVDLVILTANPWSAYRTAMEIVRPNGRVAILGLPGRGEPPLDFNPLAMEWLYAKSLTLTAVTSPVSALYAPQGHRFSLTNTAPALLDLMAAGTIEPKKLMTHRLPCEKIQEAYEMIYRREKAMLGVLFQWL
ncbi:MAG: zinc-binding alcohol dehydrogenase [Acidimicrobiia bacterium]|nr:zinc-binding alcohol dehydrogenase [Acidimicrobiia bacterium]